MLIEFIFDITRAVLRLFLSPFWWLLGPRRGCGYGSWGGHHHHLHGPGGWGYGGGHHHHGHHHHGHHHR